MTEDSDWRDKMGHPAVAAAGLVATVGMTLTATDAAKIHTQHERARHAAQHTLVEVAAGRNGNISPDEIAKLHGIAEPKSNFSYPGDMTTDEAKRLGTEALLSLGAGIATAGLAAGAMRVSKVALGAADKAKPSQAQELPDQAPSSLSV